MIQSMNIKRLKLRRFEVIMTPLSIQIKVIEFIRIISSSVLKKCRGKLDCLIQEMLFIRERKPKLNTQSDSIRAKVFI